MNQEMVVIIVQNSLGQLFIHQRNANKKTFPSFYGLGAGGHVEVGELPNQAASRELKEELDIQTKVEPLFSFDFRFKDSNHLMHVFQTVYDGDIKSCDEFQRSGWLDTQDIDKIAEDNKLCPDTKILYEKRKEQFLRQKQ